ncbi:hypothetical protein [Mycolicibacterium sphagni]|uniref:Uncharacterized protein n=1 Tax=Mycolicibacterium sphagni TaxID=1786 RepID=A0A255DSW6_9MYCO|nr:hypothetical protein [Mycolicibacterium sphagni]MCV7176367.1 hypothetical protein [Mycolicibacterium sphagni]OYN82324.1 hypothetical protein CG716_03445 [Mycolicibacterium sphagni]
MSTNATTRPEFAVDAPATKPLPLGTEPPHRRWVSSVLGALGILVLGVLVAAVVTVSHESSRPIGQSHPQAPAATSTTLPVSTVALAPQPSAPPSPSWSVAATASTLAAPPSTPAATPKREPSVRQRLHDMFPQLFPKQH